MGGWLRMSNATERNARALTLLIVWSVALGGLFAALLALTPAARAGTCDQVGGVITGDWTINVTDSKITGFTDSEISSLGINTDDNNDAPLMAWATTTASVYRSRIERLYEYTGGTPGNLVLTATSNLYAYDSYIGADYSNLVGVHNELRVDGTSNAYLYNVTIDRTQDPAAKSDWAPAFRPTAAGGNVDFMRWLYATVVDSSGSPVSSATVGSTLSPSSTTAQYPDNALATTPTSRTLWYLHRTSSGTNAWNRTDANGLARIPLFTDQITT